MIECIGYFIGFFIMCIGVCGCIGCVRVGGCVWVSLFSGSILCPVVMYYYFSVRGG